MPLYEYQCDTCGRRFEVIVKFSDPPAEKCPTCGGPVHKLFSSPAIQFKGSGFYITDYAKKEYAEATKAGNAEKSGGSDPKTETKDTGEKSDKSGKSEKAERGSSASQSSQSSSSSASTLSTLSTPSTSSTSSTVTSTKTSTDTNRTSKNST